MIDKWGDWLPDLIAGFVHVKAVVSKITGKLMGRDLI